MPRLTGLHQRAGIFQLRVLVPKDLQARFGRSYVRKSLGTSDRSEAELLGTIERARLLALFASATKSSGALPTLSEQAQKVLEPLHGILVSGETNAGHRASQNTGGIDSPLPTLPATKKTAAVSPQAGPALFAEMPTLSELYKRWLRAKKRARSSEQACLLAIDTCEKALGRLPVDQLSRAHGDAFRSWLLDQPISAKTARESPRVSQRLIGLSQTTTAVF